MGCSLEWARSDWKICLLCLYVCRSLQHLEEEIDVRMSEELCQDTFAISFKPSGNHLP
jgi:hypothetical protein